MNMHCWLERPNGHALLNDQGDVVGEIINLDKRIYQKSNERLYGPSEWFEWHVYKKREGRESA